MLQTGMLYWLFCATPPSRSSAGCHRARGIRPVENAPILAIVIVTLGSP
jgi:hypothetical protein